MRFAFFHDHFSWKSGLVTANDEIYRIQCCKRQVQFQIGVTAKAIVNLVPSRYQDWLNLISVFRLGYASTQSGNV